jgi:hypothetical protein
MQKLKLLLTFVFAAILLNIQAQTSEENNKHLSLGTGFSQITFRDIATSPLFYSGMGVNLLASTDISNQNWSHHFGFEGLFGSCNSMIPADMEYSAVTSSSLNAINLRYQALRKLTQMSTEKQQFWLGGEALLSTHIRSNESLGNNASGFEILNNYLLSGKYNLNISSLSNSTWIARIIKSKSINTQDFSISANLGLLNLNFRPGYAYSYDAEMNGSETSGLAYRFSDYALKINGWRLGTKLEYAQKRASGNGFKIAYTWDAVHAPGRYEIYQMAAHSLSYSLLINLK